VGWAEIASGPHGSAGCVPSLAHGKSTEDEAVRLIQGLANGSEVDETVSGLVSAMRKNLKYSVRSLDALLTVIWR